MPPSTAAQLHCRLPHQIYIAAFRSKVFLNAFFCLVKVIIVARTIVSGSVPRTVPANTGLPPATNLEKGIKLQETRLGYKKIFLPVPLDGTEKPTDRALVYYTATAKIESEGDKVPYRTRLAVLVEILCLESVSGLTIDEIFRTYKSQLWDPSHWEIKSYHDNTGKLTPDAMEPGTRVLKSIGSAYCPH